MSNQEEINEQICVVLNELCILNKVDHYLIQEMKKLLELVGLEYDGSSLDKTFQRVKH